jgi:hypothetical protein
MPAWTGAGLIADKADVDAVVAAINQTYRAGTEALAYAVQTASDAELTPDATLLLPAIEELRPLLPWPGGLLRGATVAAIGSSSLVLALVAGGMSQGGWATVVGQPWFGVAAAQEYGVPLERLALVPDPGPDWPTVVGALIDGVDLVVLTVPDPTAGIVRSLQARAREKGCVLVPTGRWPGSDLVMERTAVEWAGLGKGRGRLKWQKATFQASGRGRAARPRTLEMIFPPLSVLRDQGRLAGEAVGVPWGSPLLSPPVWRSPDETASEDTRPQNRRPAPADEHPMWSNLQPNEPPAGMRSVW